MRMPQPIEVQIKKALVLDLDGTIRHSASGEFIDGPDDVVIFGDVEDKIMEYANDDFLILGASNQGGVAFGHKTVDDVEAELYGTLDRLKMGNPFTAIFFAYNHESGSVEPFNYRSLLRKPEIGMLVMAEVEARKVGIVIDWDNSLFVGDREEDRECAEKAGIEFQWAWEFFGREKPE